MGNSGRTRRNSVVLPAALMALAACGNGDRAGEEAAASAVIECAGPAREVDIYRGLSGDQLIAVRQHHLRAFMMAAAAINADEADVPPDQAAMLVEQGLGEVYEPVPDEFGTLDMGIVRAAATRGLNRPQMMQRIRAAESEFERAGAELDASALITATRMIDIAVARYRRGLSDMNGDPLAHQHAMGLALAARAALSQRGDQLRRQNLVAYSQAQGALSRFVDQWDQPTAPDEPLSCVDVVAHAIRARESLSQLD